MYIIKLYPLYLHYNCIKIIISLEIRDLQKPYTKKTNELLIAVRLQVYFWPKDHENGRKMLEKLIKLLPRCFALCFCVYFGDLRLAKAIFSKCWLDVLRSRERELHVSESSRYFENIIFASLKSPK